MSNAAGTEALWGSDLTEGEIQLRALDFACELVRKQIREQPTLDDKMRMERYRASISKLRQEILLKVLTEGNYTNPLDK